MKVMSFHGSDYDIEKIIYKRNQYPTIQNLDEGFHPREKVFIKDPISYQGLPIIIKYEGYIVEIIGKYEKGKPALLCSHPQFKKTKLEIL